MWNIPFRVLYELKFFIFFLLFLLGHVSRRAQQKHLSGAVSGMSLHHDDADDVNHAEYGHHGHRYGNDDDNHHLWRGFARITVAGHMHSVDQNYSIRSGRDIPGERQQRKKIAQKGAKKSSSISDDARADQGSNDGKDRSEDEETGNKKNKSNRKKSKIKKIKNNEDDKNKKNDFRGSENDVYFNSSMADFENENITQDDEFTKIPFIRFDVRKLEAQKKLCWVTGYQEKVEFFFKDKVREWCKTKVNLTRDPANRHLFIQVGHGNTGSSFQFRIIIALLRLKEIPVRGFLIPKTLPAEYKSVEDFIESKHVVSQLVLKMHGIHPEALYASDLIFASWKREDCREQNMLILQKACRCCVSSKMLLKDQLANQAIIYMTGFSLGLELSTAEVTFIQNDLYKWIYKKYCENASETKKYCTNLSEFISKNKKVMGRKRLYTATP